MIIDITGTVLTPGNGGKDCLGNGYHDGIECCCDECDYMKCCFENDDFRMCLDCGKKECPRYRNTPAAVAVLFPCRM